MADTFVFISNLVSTNLQFLVCFVPFLELFFDDELPRNDLDNCFSSGVPPVAVIGNSYTLITIYAKLETLIHNSMMLFFIDKHASSKDLKCSSFTGYTANRFTNSTWLQQIQQRQSERYSNLHIISKTVN